LAINSKLQHELHFYDSFKTEKKTKNTRIIATNIIIKIGLLISKILKEVDSKYLKGLANAWR